MAERASVNGCCPVDGSSEKEADKGVKGGQRSQETTSQTRDLMLLDYLYPSRLLYRLLPGESVFFLVLLFFQLELLVLVGNGR